MSTKQIIAILKERNVYFRLHGVRQTAREKTHCRPLNGLLFPLNGLLFPLNGLLFPLNGLLFPINCSTCAFRASCCSARLSRAHVPAFAGPLSVTEKKGEGVRGTACTGGYKGVRTDQSESVAGGGWFEVLWNLECPVGLSQKRNMCAFH